VIAGDVIPARDEPRGYGRVCNPPRHGTSVGATHRVALLSPVADAEEGEAVPRPCE